MDVVRGEYEAWYISSVKDVKTIRVIVQLKFEQWEQKLNIFHSENIMI